MNEIKVPEYEIMQQINVRLFHLELSFISWRQLFLVEWMNAEDKLIRRG